MSYAIEFITDERDKGTKKKLVLMDKRLKKSLGEMDGVRVRDATKIREIKWDALGSEKAHKQWRKKYIISKSNRKYTWNKVMGKINKIQAPYYKRIQKTIIRVK